MLRNVSTVARFRYACFLLCLAYRITICSVMSSKCIDAPKAPSITSLPMGRSCQLRRNASTVSPSSGRGSRNLDHSAYSSSLQAIPSSLCMYEQDHMVYSVENTHTRVDLSHPSSTRLMSIPLPPVHCLFSAKLLLCPEMQLGYNEYGTPNVRRRAIISMSYYIYRIGLCVLLYSSRAHSPFIC
jgi:hypothetical protein